MGASLDDCNTIVQTQCTNTTIGKYWTGHGGTTAGGCDEEHCTNTTTGKYWTGHGGTTAGGCGEEDCTNKPSNSSYTGHGGTTNNCAWECNNSYIKSGDECIAMTAAPTAAPTMAPTAAPTMAPTMAPTAAPAAPAADALDQYELKLTFTNSSGWTTGGSTFSPEPVTIYFGFSNKANVDNAIVYPGFCPPPPPGQPVPIGCGGITITKIEKGNLGCGLEMTCTAVGSIGMFSHKYIPESKDNQEIWVHITIDEPGTFSWDTARWNGLLTDSSAIGKASEDWTEESLATGTFDTISTRGRGGVVLKKDYFVKLIYR